jgi:hypothetical protein
MQKEMKRKNISILREKRGFWWGSARVKKRIFGAQKNDN